MAEDSNAKRILVILPTYNESVNLAKMVNAIKALSLNIEISILIPIIFYNRKLERSKMNKTEIPESLFFVLYLKLLLGLKIFHRRKPEEI